MRGLDGVADDGVDGLADDDEGGELSVSDEVAVSVASVSVTEDDDTTADATIARRINRKTRLHAPS